MYYICIHRGSRRGVMVELETSKPEVVGSNPIGAIG